MIKVGFIGPPSSGKTTTALALADMLVAEGVGACYREEYATQWIRRHRRLPTISDQEEIYDLQLVSENYAPAESEVMVTDTALHLSYLYSTMVMRADEKDWDSFLRITRWMLRDLHRYDLLFFLPSLGLVESAEHRLEQHLLPQAQTRIHNSIVGLLAQYDIRHELAISNDLEVRVAKAFGAVMERVKGARAAAG